MRINNLFRTVFLIFLLSAVLLSAVGCHRASLYMLPDNSETNSQPSNQDIPAESKSKDDMSKKWEDVIGNTTVEIKSIDMKRYTILPAYSSIATKVQEFTLEDAVVIEDLIAIVRELDVSFEDFEFDENGINEFYNSHIGKQKIEIMLMDSDGNLIFGLCLYENGDIDVLEAREITETRKTYRHMYRVYFENSNSNIYSAFDSFCENNLTK